MSDVSTVDVSQNVSDAQIPNSVAPGESQADTPATTTGPADTAASGQPTEGEGDHTQKPTRDRRAEKRIASLTRRVSESEREAGYWRGIAEASRGQQTTTAADPNAKPQSSQYKNYDEFTEALADWKLDQKLKARETEHQQRSQTQAAASKANERNNALAERLVQSGSAIEDFDDVMETITAPGFPISPAMRDYLEECEHPAHMAQWMADNQEEARRIYGLNSAAAVRALDKAAASVAPGTQRKTSAAPPPVPTVGGRSVTTRDPKDMSMDEYAHHWRERQAKR